MLRATVGLSALLVLACPPAAAQVVPGVGAEGEVGFAFSLRQGLTRAVGHTLPVLGLEGVLRLSPSFEAGGEGVLGLRRLPVSSGGSAGSAFVELGYGGLRLRHHTARQRSPQGWNVALLLGAGTARVLSALAETELGTDNFIVVEPSMAHSRSVGGSFVASLSAGYRFTPGADALPGVASGALRGAVASLELRLVMDP